MVIITLGKVITFEQQKSQPKCENVNKKFGIILEMFAIKATQQCFFIIWFSQNFPPLE